MTLSPIRKIYFGVADRRQMFRLFDRHAQRPNRWQNDDGALFAGEWFEIARPEHDYMLDILPPLWMRGEMFALGEFLTGSITSVFYALRINGADRCFHAYCDLARPGSPVEMRDAIVERERRPVKAMTREERIEHPSPTLGPAARARRPRQRPDRPGTATSSWRRRPLLNTQHARPSGCPRSDRRI